MLKKILSKTKLSGAKIVPVSAKQIVNDSNHNFQDENGLNELMKILKENIILPLRDSKGQLLLAIDHCFLIRGQGTILTGTVIQGSIKVNQV